MAFDPSVISEIPNGLPNPAAAKQQAYTLAGQIDEQKLNHLKLQQAQENQQDLLKTKNILRENPIDFSKPETLTRAAEKISREVSPDYAMKFMRQSEEVLGGQYENQIKQFQLAQEESNIVSQAVDPLVSKLMDMQRAGATPAMLNAAARAESVKAIQNLLEGNPKMKPKVDALLKSNPNGLDFETLKTIDMNSKQGLQFYKERLATYAQQDKDLKEENERRKTNAQIQNWQSLEARRLNLEENAGLKPGYKWADKEHTKQEIIPGGPADPNSPGGKGTGLSSREGVFFDRVLGAGNELGISLSNVMELPIGKVSSGLLGYGGAPGESLFRSTSNALKNKLTSQDVQDYMSMMPGVAKSLASIDAQGLQSSVNLSNMMEKLTIKEGDTGFTKLRKIADMRQIAEKGLEIWLSHPKIAEPQRDKINQVLDQLRADVPFTQHDITMYQRSLKKNPGQTFLQFAQSKGIGTKPSQETNTVKPIPMDGKNYIRDPSTGNWIEQ